MAGEQVADDATQGVAEETDNDFNAGFAPEQAPTETPAPAPDATPAAAPVAEVAEPRYAQITEDELASLRTRAALVDEISSTSKRQFDTAFGKIGALEQIIAKQRTATPAGEAVQIDEADFAELKDAYPELTEVTLKGLNRMMGKLKGTGGDSQAIEKAVTPLRDDMLEIAFPGWQDDVKTPDFAAWRKTQGPAVEALAASDSQKDAAKLLRMFYARTKTEAPAPAAAPAPVTPPAPAAPSARQRQIAAAVNPRGDGGHPPAAAEDDQFESGFKYRSG